MMQTHSPETRAKIAALKRGVPRSAETRAKISAAMKSNANAKRWPDCPLELRADYKLLRRKRYLAAEARAILEGGA
jgi:hypothetical protein